MYEPRGDEKDDHNQARAAFLFWELRAATVPGARARPTSPHTHSAKDLDRGQTERSCEKKQ